MTDRVLDERLQHESWNETVESVPGDVVADAKPVRKAQPLDVEIRLDRDEFLA